MPEKKTVRILFVDDEQIMREGLARIVDWAAYRFEVVGSAVNGKAALAILEKTDVDIVVADIRMPVMDGLELTKVIATRFPHIKVIILSAYDEFQYVQQALRYGACEYMLKADIDRSSLLATVLRVAETLPKDDADAGNADAIHFQLASLCENCLMGLLQQPVCSPETQLQLDALHIPLSGERLLLVHCLSENVQGAAEVLRAFLAQRFDNLSLLTPEPGCCAALCNAKPLCHHQFLSDTMESLQGALAEKGMGKFLLVYSPFFNEYANIYVHNQILEEQMVFLKFYEETGVHFCAAPPCYSVDSGMPSMLSGLMRLLDQNRYTDACAHIHDSLKEYTKLRCHPSEVKEFACTAVQMMMDKACSEGFLESYEKVFPAWKNQQVVSLRQHVYGCVSLAELLEASGQWTQSIARHVGQTDLAYSRLVCHAIDFIDHHLHEELPLKRVAQEIYCNPVYLSQIFKKETGRNFSDYILAKRMGKAQELLAQTQIPIQQVAEQVGIRNPSYFSKVFTKETGLQPNKYRAKKKRNAGKQP